MAVKSLNDLFLHTLKDVYSAEKQILKQLPKMAKIAKSADLKHAFESDREETGRQIHRLETILEQCGASSRAIHCKAMDGLLAEAKDIMEDAADPEVCEAGMLAAAHAVEQYEISRYGALIAWADKLGLQQASKLLRETLEEEQRADRLLVQIAEASGKATKAQIAPNG